MNNDRRAKLADLWEQLEAIRAAIETIGEEEQDYLDNMPESFQSGEKGEKASEAIDAIGNACSSIDDAVQLLQDAVD